MKIRGIPIASLMTLARDNPGLMTKLENIRGKMIDVEVVQLRIALKCKLSDVSRMDPKFSWLPEDLKDEADFVSFDGTFTNGWILDGHVHI